MFKKRNIPGIQQPIITKLWLDLIEWRDSLRKTFKVEKKWSKDQIQGSMNAPEKKKKNWGECNVLETRDKRDQEGKGDPAGKDKGIQKTT